MHIIKLTAENVKRLKAIEITPEGNLVVIGGMNDQGKTSTIDSIAMAFGGKKYIPAKPVRKGTKKAKIVAETEDLIITRTMTEEGGGTLKVGTKDGKLYQSPQAILDALTGQLTFDPLLFSRMKPDKQLETLKELVGLDFTKLEGQRYALYNNRAEVNKEGKRLVAILESMTEYPEAPKEEILVSGLMKELENRREHNKKIDEEKKALETFQAKNVIQSKKITDIGKNIKELEWEISNLQKKEAELQFDFKERGKAEAEKKEQIENMVEANTQEITDQIISAEEINRKVRSNQKRNETENDVNQLREKSQKLTDEINIIDSEKEFQLSEAEFPIDNLSFNEDGVLFNDIPFDQLSSSEQLKISTAMGFAMNPKLKVLLIRDGSLLDNDNLKLLAEMAEKEDAQIWLEKVGEGKEVSVIIEDGTIKKEV